MAQAEVFGKLFNLSSKIKLSKGIKNEVSLSGGLKEISRNYLEFNRTFAITNFANIFFLFASF